MNILWFITKTTLYFAGSLGSDDGTPRQDASEGDSIAFIFIVQIYYHLMILISYTLRSQIAISGYRSKDYFDRYGDLKRIRRLKFWPMDRLLVDKYKFPEPDAQEFAQFLCPLLDFAPDKQPAAAQCPQHPGLKINDPNPTIENKAAGVEKLEAGMSKAESQSG